MHTPASPGDSENNTPQEVEESVVAAVSIRHIQEVIDSTTPDMSALEQVTAGNKFVHFRPWRLEFSGDIREDAARLIENEYGGFHVFSERAKDEFIEEITPLHEAVMMFNAPTADVVHGHIQTTSYSADIRGCSDLTPGAVAVAFDITIPPKTKLATAFAQHYANLADKFRALISSVAPEWVVSEIKDPDTRWTPTDDSVKDHGTLWKVVFKIQLPEDKLDAMAAFLAKKKLEKVSRINPSFIAEHAKVTSLRTSFVVAGFAYATEAAWDAVASLPTPKECKDYDSWKITAQQFVSQAELVSEYVTATPSRRKAIRETTRAMNPGYWDGSRLFDDMDYRLDTKGYAKEDNEAQRLMDGMETGAKFLFGIDTAPPFYSGLFNLLLKAIVEPERFLGDIAAKSNLTLPACQEIIFRRVYQTKAVFDRLRYLRIKPTPELTAQMQGYCDVNYQAKALRTIATAIKAAAPKTSSSSR
jgi:hypothetical protein